MTFDMKNALGSWLKCLILGNMITILYTLFDLILIVCQYKI